MKIISQAPTRISLFGGGTDVNPYAERYGGVVFNIAINIRQRFILDDTKRNVSNVWVEGDSADFMRTFIKPYNWSNLIIEHYFDGLLESGLGSSASAAVALIGAVNRLKRINMSKDEIAEKAWDIEVNQLGLYGGKQDQYCAVYGGVNLMEFGEKVIVNQLSPSFIESLFPYLVLFYTGKNRRSGKIQEGFKEPTREQIDTLNEIKALCGEGVEAIANKDIERVGRLLDIAWDLKKKSNKGVTNERIDLIYETAIKAGAMGGKIMGAGGGGHMLFICEPDKQDNLKEALATMGCTWVDFSPDFNGLETRIL